MPPMAQSKPWHVKFPTSYPMEAQMTHFFEMFSMTMISGCPSHQLPCAPLFELAQKTLGYTFVDSTRTSLESTPSALVVPWP